MWFRSKKWIAIISLAATLILLAGVVGGVAYAQNANTQPASNDPGKTMMARVATILGIDQTKLESAFTQAQKEMQEEQMANLLKSLVDQGVLTQQQADQYQQWWQSKPDLPADIGPMGGMGPSGPHGRPGMGPGGPPPAPPAEAPGTN